jgi:hypothetical protein
MRNRGLNCDYSGALSSRNFCYAALITATLTRYSCRWLCVRRSGFFCVESLTVTFVQRELLLSDNNG